MPAPRTYPLQELAAHLGGEIAGVGNPGIRGIATLRNAGASDLSFFTHSRYKADLLSTAAGAILLSPANRDITTRLRIICAEPYLAYAKAVELLHPAREVRPGIHPSASIDPGASVDRSAEIGENCVIAAGAVIGPDSIIGPGCLIGENS